MRACAPGCSSARNQAPSERTHEEAKEEQEEEEPMPRDRPTRGHKNIPPQHNQNTCSTPKVGKPRAMPTIKLLTSGRQTFTSQLVRNSAQLIEKRNTSRTYSNGLQDLQFTG
jgi:hypothetical protein